MHESSVDSLILNEGINVMKEFGDVSAKRGKPQTPSAEDINDLAKDDYIFDTTSCWLKGG